MTVNYFAALHGAKINSHEIIRVTKTASLMSGIEPKAFRSQTVYVTTTLHWCSNIQYLNMVYNHVWLSRTIIKTFILYLSVAAPLPLSMLLLSTILLFVVVDVVDAVRFHVLSLMLLVSFVSSFGRRLPTTKYCSADGFGLAQTQEGGSRTQGGL